MAILRELRSRARYIAPPVLGACLFAYFAYHAVQGDRGIIAWLVLSQQIREARATEAELGRERAALERRVALLSPSSLDPDLLDERARAMLNLAHSDDVIIMLDGPRDSGPGQPNN